MNHENVGLIRGVCVQGKSLSAMTVFCHPSWQNFYKKMEVYYEKHMQVGNLVSLENELDV